MSSPVQPPAGRYGPEPSPRRRRRTVAGLWVLGLVGLAATLWVGAGVAAAPVTWRDIGFDTARADRVEVVYEVIRPDPSVPVRCTVQALNQQYAQVGVIEVDVPASPERTVQLRTVVRVSEPAVTGLVDRCRATDG